MTNQYMKTAEVIAALKHIDEIEKTLTHLYKDTDKNFSNKIKQLSKSISEQREEILLLKKEIQALQENENNRIILAKTVFEGE